ncbi:ribosome biogenesis GTPase Der [Candidatus Saccharibacteria bacterium]|nr:ribosome biogenesis GTPase Der [Candidatus Saccharibacteria bacterium]MBI3338304.1 ribosome biogenesis GTPase Der [Candidatus Saccharibacteria bacterium]
MKKLPIVAIVGRANVGKSSLFNAILDHREAIVAQEAGTTRDSIWAKADYNGQHFWLIDTAGIKDAEDDFEFTIQEQIQQAADSADVIWVVIEADALITDEDRRVAKMALKTRKPVFLVVNKFDKKLKAIPEDYQRLGIKPIILTSTTQNRGIEDLLDQLTLAIPHMTEYEANDRMHLAILGRPNVGKSALFNALAKKQQAIVADRAGTTRDVNRTIVRYKSKEIELMDTAGIRRAGKIGQGIERFSVIRSLAAIEQSDVCLLLMDANELHVTLDQKIAGMVKEAGKGLILVVSKWDSLDKDAFTRDSLAPQIVNNYDFVPWAPLIFTSSVSGQNVTKLFDLLLDIVDKRQTSIKTRDLNRWLRETVDKHPPAGLKNRMPKLNYIIQEEDSPINFKVYGAHTKFLHWSYKRFMERELREAFGFDGTPIKFWFFEKHETHKHGVSPTKERNREIRRREHEDKIS